MSLHFSGVGREAWSASLALQDLPLGRYGRNSLSIVPVALDPSDGGIIRLKSTKNIQEKLSQASPQYRDISDVRQYGKGGAICKSANLACIGVLLRCPNLASHPISPFIPSHLACVKGVVRDIESTLSPAEVLELFSEVGVTSVHRCLRVVDGT